ncbi:kinase-like domain-containing protein [Fusarium sp. MPI-SDFR-AT-0072]|nr:kinase-like domain-containing protein [Fusarium sp. MPI-SDFR-AT-0072]
MASYVAQASYQSIAMRLKRLEFPADYRSGGYHPVQINDKLHSNRYRIVHKVGHGSSSTVWLARDKKTSEYVAIKVGRADSNKNEGQTMSRLSAASKSKPFTPKLLDRFTIEGPNGSHPCLVTAPASSLVDAKLASTSHLFQLSTACSLATQSIMAIAHVHSLGYAHGNFHLNKILLPLPSLNSLSIKQLYAKYGEPLLEPVYHIEGSAVVLLPRGVPSHLVQPISLGVPSDEILLQDANVLISDFGDAFRPEDKTTFKSNAPSTVRTWSLGCASFELFAHRTLFSYIIPYAGRITAQQVHLSGSFIGEWLDKWEGREKYFNEDLKQLTDPRFIYPWSKSAALLNLLKKMLQWRPMEQPTAQQILKSKWVKEWAMPAYKGDKERPFET